MEIQEVKDRYESALFYLRLMREYKDEAVKAWKKDLKRREERSEISNVLRLNIRNIRVNLLDYETLILKSYLGQIQGETQ